MLHEITAAIMECQLHTRPCAEYATGQLYLLLSHFIFQLDLGPLLSWRLIFILKPPNLFLVCLAGFPTHSHALVPLYLFECIYI